MRSLSENIRDIGDVMAGATAFGTVINALPEIAAVLAIIWTMIRIYEWARIRIFRIKEEPGSPPLD